MNKEDIKKSIDYVLKETNFKSLGERKVGKVRDIYFQNDKLILVATDRHSSFDRIIAHIPFKGQVLTQTSLFWFEKTRDILPNHALACPDPNVVVGQKCQVVPLEVVPRAYITGSTNTSLWTHYQNGRREFGNFTLPDGLRKNEKLASPILTFTTKSDEHDEEILPQDIVEKGLVSETLFSEITAKALELFKRGQEIAAERGLILVDTKYEFGLDASNSLMLIDEIHTPDSSRYWMLPSYEEKFSKGKEPEYFDKEFLRLWFRDNCDPYQDEILPEAPKDMVAELSSRYIQIYEQLTGKAFSVDVDIPLAERIEKNVEKYART